MKWLLFLSLISSYAIAQTGSGKFGDLSAEDQKYYKNEMGMGMNQLERIDSTVKEINKLHGEISSMKAEMQKMKKEIEELKKGK